MVDDVTSSWQREFIIQTSWIQSIGVRTMHTPALFVTPLVAIFVQECCRSSLDISYAFQLPLEGNSLPRKYIRSPRRARSRIRFSRVFLRVYTFFQPRWIVSLNTLFLFAFTVDCARDATLLGDLRLLITSSDVTLSYSRLPFFYARDRACVTTRQSFGCVEAPSVLRYYFWKFWFMRLTIEYTNYKSE